MVQRLRPASLHQLSAYCAAAQGDARGGSRKHGRERRGRRLKARGGDSGSIGAAVPTRVWLCAELNLPGSTPEPGFKIERSRGNPHFLGCCRSAEVSSGG